MGCCLDSSGSEYGPVAYSCEHNNDAACLHKSQWIFELSEQLSYSQKGLCFMESVICMSAWVFFQMIYSNIVILSEHDSPYLQNHTFCWLIIFTLIPITELRERKYTSFELLARRMWLLHRSIVNEMNSNVVLVVLMLVIRQCMWLPSYGWPRSQGCNVAGVKSDHPASLNLGTNNRWKSHGIALLITFRWEMYLEIRDESCVVCWGGSVLLLG